MGQVNAGYNDLLQILHNMQVGIHSIETTRDMIKLKYQQLGSDWTDKKYRELGDVVQECYRALGDVLKIILQAEKYVATLAKTVQEYDNVSLGESNSARNAFAQGLRVDDAGQGNSYEYCLGVLTQGSFPNGYSDVLTQRYENAEPMVKKVFDSFADKLMIRDSNYPVSEIAHYTPNGTEEHPRGVYYNAAADMNDPRGAGNTYYHELAHMIDHAATEYEGNLSNSPEFAVALIQDGQQILRRYNGLSSDRQSSFLQRISQHSAHSLSDLLDATTGGQLHGRYGHSQTYWTRPGNLQAEAFAHFFEASMGNYDKMFMLANFFPTAFGIFSSMIKSIASTGYARTRTLER